ncbi:MAG: hypothetical protein ABSA30_00770 [Candidatus Aminicenantales bacterium]|jgi:hypothetical protein
MKRAFLAGLLLLALGGACQALTLEAGLLWGMRSLKNADLNAVFGTGTAFSPYAALRITPGGSIGISYETGFSRQAPVGLFNDLFHLQVSVAEIFFRQEWQVGAVSPYIKIGPGVAFYKINIDSPYLKAYDSHGSDISFSMAAGAKVKLGARIFLCGEIKYGALWLDPFDDKVDLGGIRAQVGVGIVL